MQVKISGTKNVPIQIYYKLIRLSRISTSNQFREMLETRCDLGKHFYQRNNSVEIIQLLYKLLVTYQ